MSFRTSEYLQRYGLIRFQLDDVIKTPANTNKKMGISLQLMTGLHFMIGIMLILRCNFSCKKKLMEQIMLLQIV